jgi:hypothetical protein
MATLALPILDAPVLRDAVPRTSERLAMTRDA